MITLEELYQLIKQQSEQVEPLELLFLSACETAQGDRRAVLGIAGFAAQAGARSTVASLWQVDASSTVSLVSQFYKHLSEGQSKAEALRSAQIDIKNNPNTRHPYYWSPFVVVGSWL